MNAIFIKEVQDSALKGRLVKLIYSDIGNEDYVIEINISNKVINYINENIVNLKETVIKQPKKSSLFNSLYTKYLLSKFKHELKKIIEKNNLIGYSSIYSNSLKKNKNAKEYIEGLFNQFSINEYVIISTVKNNVDKYIHEYILRSNLKLQDICPLIIVKNTENLSYSFIEDLNNKYKNISIYVPEKPCKLFLNKINTINDEFGSCINILNRSEKDFRKYNTCIFIDKPRTEYSRYKFNKTSCFIDFTNKENDKFNDKYIKLEKDLKNNLYNIAKIKELYEAYGKVTVSNAIID